VSMLLVGTARRGNVLSDPDDDVAAAAVRKMPSAVHPQSLTHIKFTPSYQEKQLKRKLR
jgi:hypothetical protein